MSAFEFEVTDIRGNPAMEGPVVYRLDEEQRAALESALQRAETALNDWIFSYAPEFSGEENVKKTMARLKERGTLWYVATVLDEVREAKKFVSRTDAAPQVPVVRESAYPKSEQSGATQPAVAASFPCGVCKARFDCLQHGECLGQRS